MTNKFKTNYKHTAQNRTINNVSYTIHTKKRGLHKGYIIIKIEQVDI